MWPLPSGTSTISALRVSATPPSSTPLSRMLSVWAGARGSRPGPLPAFQAGDVAHQIAHLVGGKLERRHVVVAPAGEVRHPVLQARGVAHLLACERRRLDPR